jgi:transposase
MSRTFSARDNNGSNASEFQIVFRDWVTLREQKWVNSRERRGRGPIWFGGQDRSEASMSQFYQWLGEKKSRRISLALMDMWKPFRNAAQAQAPQAAILFDKFHVMRHLGEALDAVRKAEYARLSGKDRRFIKGQKYTLLSRRENLSLEGREALKTLLAATKRLNTAYLLKESFGQLWSMNARAGHGASSTTGGQRSNGSASSPTRHSPR